MIKKGAFVVVFSLLAAASVFAENATETPAQRFVRVAEELLDTSEISYVYGGDSWGEGKDCEECSDCMVAKSPRPTQRLQMCPACARCSMDCSHFVQLVFDKAGVKIPYLTTADMQKISAKKLASSFGFLTLAGDVRLVRPGDLLVYPTHVVIVERTYPNGRADLIHATAGRDLKGPGLGVQRERMAEMITFRGPLQKVLRHQTFLGGTPPFSTRP